MHSVLGNTFDDEISQMLGTGYRRFESPLGIHGLFIKKGARLDLLAIIAATPGKGCFRSFMDAAKKEFGRIYVWEIMNDWLGESLVRYGFVETKGKAKTGETLNGYRWKKGK